MVKIIQIPISFDNILPNISIQFQDKEENYGKIVRITIKEHKSNLSIPKKWTYEHIIQSTNIVEFTSFDYGNYNVYVNSIDEKEISNPYSIETTNNKYEIHKILFTDEINTLVTLKKHNDGVGDITARGYRWPPRDRGNFIFRIPPPNLEIPFPNLETPPPNLEIPPLE